MTYKIVCNRTASVDQEELEAFQEAVKDPELRKKIISILEEAGLLGESNHQPD